MVQGLLARHALCDLLTELGVLTEGETLDGVLPQVRFVLMLCFLAGTGGHACMCFVGVCGWFWFAMAHSVIINACIMKASAVSKEQRC